ncbi:hypothetical protein J1605_009982 [Eschrichtius robustus]|uniref:Uncharacterized protein n=1 Tax=Eschrichtius robustus TaxID=9764 RepID=A0AB34GTM8_ESCRO|nr:hypothetical protein J1605_009982 [Eschrichtius robustus]
MEYEWKPDEQGLQQILQLLKFPLPLKERLAAFYGV